jgi:hypothetical protein
VPFSAPGTGGPPRYDRRWLYTFVIGLVLLLTAGVTRHCGSPARSPQLAAHTLQPTDAILSLAGEHGFDTVVQLLAWRDIEPTQNQFHWQATDQLLAATTYYGLNLIVRLDQHPAWASPVDMSINAPPEKLEDYADYVERVVGRYRGRLAGVILWNEPNLAIEWGGQPPDPVAFTELLCTGYTAAKSADPKIVVVAAGLAPTTSNTATAMDDRRFLREMYQAGPPIVLMCWLPIPTVSASPPKPRPAMTVTPPLAGWLTCAGL